MRKQLYVNNFENAQLKTSNFIAISISSKEVQEENKTRSYQEATGEGRLRHQLDSHRLPRPDSEERNSTRRERDAAAHRRFQDENPEGRHIEQQRDTAARRRVRIENPEGRHIE